MPCFTTLYPIPANVRDVAVEQLKELRPSPPVPTTSMQSPSSPSTRLARPRAMPTAWAISSGVSPFMRRPIRKHPAWAGDMRPSHDVRKSGGGHVSRQVLPGGQSIQNEVDPLFLLSGWNDVVREIPQELKAVRRQDGFRVELDAHPRAVIVAQGHDFPFRSAGGDGKAGLGSSSLDWTTREW